MAQEYTEEELSKEAMIEDSRREYLGKEADPYIRRDDEPVRLDWSRIREFAWGIGDDNPLFCDPLYAAKTRWGCQIAPPTIITHVRYPMAHGSQKDKPYRVNHYYAECKMEWFDVIRPGDSIRSSLIFKDIKTKEGKSGPMVFFYTEGKFWNQYDRVIAGQQGTCIFPELPAGKRIGDVVRYEAAVYKYSEEEIERIVKDYDSEYRRGAKTLYWEDVKVGDKVQPVVKGPLSMMDFVQYQRGCQAMSPRSLPGSFKRTFQLTRGRALSFRRVHPMTNWPYEHEIGDHFDMFLSRFRGMPLPFDHGIMRTQIAEHVVTNWMGDDGFLRMLDTQVRKPKYYGDTTWFKGEVVKKYKVVEGGIEYGAVDIKIDGVNQRGEMSSPGSATVYLPSPGRPVQIPIPVASE